MNDADIDLINKTFYPGWLMVSQLRSGQEVKDGEALYRRACRWVNAARESLNKAGFSTTSCEHMLYAYCALMDESVLNRDKQDDGYRQWRKDPLQARFFRTLNAGEELWERIRTALREPAPDVAVLTCLYRTLQLGFTGQYRTQDDERREDVVRALSERVPPFALTQETPVVVRASRLRSGRRMYWLGWAAGVVVLAALWFTFSSVLSQMVTPPDLHSKEEAQWFTVTPELPGVRVRQNGDVALPVTDWQWESGSRASRLYDTLWLDSILALMAHHLTRPLSARQGELPQLNLCAAGICLTPIAATEDNLWQQQIAGITTLCPKPVFAPDLLPLPEVLLPYLPRRHGISRRMQNMRLAGGISFVFLALAMLASFINNQRLVRSVGDHLAVYHRLSGTPPEPKQQAQQRLRADSRLLDDWLRRGEPLRYGLGLYQGMRLIPPVEAAINSWTPPPPLRPVIKKIVQGPQTVRLDSMSLFDTGKWALKPASTKLLVNSLVGIKAKPGWLIVVAGHTDSTGDDPSNQVLSLKRAESVRDWMRDNDILQLESEALTLADSDGPDVALSWLQNRPGITTARSRWLLRLLMARVAEQTGKNELALHLLGELDGCAAAITLTHWEPDLLFEVKARRLKLLRMKAGRNDTDKTRLNPEMEHLLAGLIAIDPARAAVLCA